jgi:myo-inositol-1(or 4)-monophosphatase
MQPSVNIALRAMRQARDHILQVLNQNDILTPGTIQYDDALSFMNKNCYKLIFDAIKRAYPTHYVSDNADAPEGKDESWHFLGVQNPENLLRKDSASTFSLLHRSKGKVVDALVLNPLSGDEYFASRGKGASMNGRRARCSSQTRLEQGIVAINAINFIQAQDSYSELCKELALHTATLRVSGCNVLDLVMVASGQRDACILSGIELNELEAALLIGQEAGAITSQLDGGLLNARSRTIVCANPKLLKSAVQRFNRFRDL